MAVNRREDRRRAKEEAVGERLAESSRRRQELIESERRRAEEAEAAIRQMEEEEARLIRSLKKTQKMQEKVSPVRIFLMNTPMSSLCCEFVSICLRRMPRCSNPWRHSARISQCCSLYKE
jgi:hypothetical protein